jgi:hypothetical protein
MDDLPSANMPGALPATPQTMEIENDWQIKWRALSDVVDRFHAPSLCLLVLTPTSPMALDNVDPYQGARASESLHSQDSD